MEQAAQMEANMSDLTPMFAAMMQLAQTGSTRRAILITVIVLLACVLMLPFLLVTLKLDGATSFSWPVAAIPSWILQLVALCVLLAASRVPRPPGEEKDWSTEVAAAYEKCLKDAACFRLRTCVTNVFLFAFELLLVLQLEGTLNDSWFMVMCPWIALEIWWLLHRLYYSRVAWTLADPEAAVATENEAWKLLTSSSFWCFFVSFLQRGALRLLTCILIAVRADSTGGSWFAVFVPLYISSVLAVVFACIVKKKQPFLHADDEEEQGTAAPTCCLSCIWLAMLFLAAGKLDGGTYSAAWIFSPIFFFMSLAVCLLSVGISVAQPQHFAHAADIMGEPIGKPTE